MPLHELNDIVDQGAIARRLGTTRTTVNNWTGRHELTFPKPLLRLGSSSGYSWTQVADWYVRQFGMARYEQVARVGQ